MITPKGRGSQILDYSRFLPQAINKSPEEKKKKKKLDLNKLFKQLWFQRKGQSQFDKFKLEYSDFISDALNQKTAKLVEGQSQKLRIEILQSKLFK